MDEDLNTNPVWSQRRQNRATAFRFLFQWEMNPPDDLSADLTEFLGRLGGKEDFYSYAIELVDGVIDKIEVLDSIIRELVDNWEFSRIAKADLALLTPSFKVFICRSESSCHVPRCLYSLQVVSWTSPCIFVGTCSLPSPATKSALLHSYAPGPLSSIIASVLPAS